MYFEVWPLDGVRGWDCTASAVFDKSCLELNTLLILMLCPIGPEAVKCRWRLVTELCVWTVLCIWWIIWGELKKGAEGVGFSLHLGSPFLIPYDFSIPSFSTTIAWPWYKTRLEKEIIWTFQLQPWLWLQSFVLSPVWSMNSNWGPTFCFYPPPPLQPARWQPRLLLMTRHPNTALTNQTQGLSTLMKMLETKPRNEGPVSRQPRNLLLLKQR